MNSEGYEDGTNLKLALVASILTLFSLSLMAYSYTQFRDNITLDQILVAFYGAIMVLLLLAVVFAVFDRADRARTFLAIGIIALLILVVIHTVKWIDVLGQMR
ncbi:MAG: hypothetical protein WAS24_01230 [Thermoplasmata archaeon]